MLGTRSRLLIALGGLLAAASLPAACGASGSTLEDDDSDSSSSAQGGDQNTGGGFGIGVGGNSGQGGQQACAAENYAGELVPLDLLVLLDKSASMSESGKWSSVVSALQAFTGDPGSAGVGVGLQYYPVPPAMPPAPVACDVNNPLSCFPDGFCCTDALLGCTVGFCVLPGAGDSCVLSDYSSPVISIAPLPGVQSAFDGSLTSTSPDGDSTPTRPALEGAVAYASTWAQANPTHVTVIVLATDGLPNNCDPNSVGDVANVASAALAANPSIQTFVVGVGSELGSLNQIAAAGGTNMAFIVDTNANVTQQFIDALNEIRQTTNCQFLIPEPEMGDPDFNLVNVNIVDPNDPSNDTELFNVGSEGGCDPVNGGWYYDDPNAPTTIILCPQSCEDVQVSGREVEVLLGCTTIVK